MKEMEIVIPIGPWEREALEEETPIKDEKDLVELLEKSVNSAKVARMAIVCREKGIMAADVFDTNRLLFQAGAQTNVSRIARKQRAAVEAKDGKSYSFRTLVGMFNDGEEGPRSESYVPFDHKKARETVHRYLENSVPGHIWGRLILLHAMGGDVKAASLQLKRTIDEQVDKLV